MKVRFVSRLAAVLSTLAIVLLTGIAGAQEYRGRVQWAVTDPTQVSVVGASVALRNVNTGVETVKATDHTGHSTLSVRFRSTLRQSLVSGLR